MNNYGYYREHQQEIDRKIAEENAQNTVEGVQGIILIAMIIIYWSVFCHISASQPEGSAKIL